jgi:hypothetical protein
MFLFDGDSGAFVRAGQIVETETESMWIQMCRLSSYLEDLWGKLVP